METLASLVHPIVIAETNFKEPQEQFNDHSLSTSDMINICHRRKQVTKSSVQDKQQPKASFPTGSAHVLHGTPGFLDSQNGIHSASSPHSMHQEGYHQLLMT
ncbi:hypothetical protein KIL84_000782 [Mauremys mutica]|uniref:Uncharacterized protein n=1 Tax=Mauremys mutica TaxID=74926 RepID=A0A9D4ANR8_9SAUR|nr:hypothetical protein KIL84_000782 [Mauremys mutica]